jgi:glycosyltransferase involved in cell wall biosynthesis
VNDTAAFTIVSKNYFHYARVLMRSLRATHPEWDLHVVLADRAEGTLDLSSEPFGIIEAQDLPIPEFEKFTFRYSILELNTAVKPWSFKYLFALGYQRVVYLDPDIFMYSRMREVEQSLAGGALAVLVPHLTGRILDSNRPGELEILQSGTYNLGFLALGRHRSLETLLDFWCEKSLRDFVADLSRGLFTDQRWMDLVPGMFPDVSILRHEGYDVAYWNLPQREVRREGSAWLVNGADLVFFHFSGLDPLHPEGFSKHQNRYRLANLGVVADLVRDYCAVVRSHGAESYLPLGYAYGTLHDGSPIPDILRRLYQSTPEVEAWAGPDPFSRTHHEWNEPLGDEWPPLTRVIMALYQARSDVRLTWPDVIGADREHVVRWFAESPDVQAVIPECYIEPIRRALEQRGAAAPRSASKARKLPKPGLVAGALRKASIAAREGRLPLSPRRWLQLLRLHEAEEAQRAVARSAAPLPPVPWPERDHGRGPTYSGFYPQSAAELSAGYAWMGRCGSIRLAGAKPSSRVTIAGHHQAATHRRARGTAALRVSATAGDVPLGEDVICLEGPFELSLTLPAGFRDGSRIRLRADGAFVPAASGLDTDQRELSVLVRTVTVDGHPLLDFARGANAYRLTDSGESTGLTIVGYLADGTGVAAGAHASVEACEAAGIPCEVIDARPLEPSRGRYPVSLMHVNADETPRIAGLLGERFFLDRYTVGTWAWELEELPDNVLDAFNWVDEVWAVSGFVHQAIADKSPVPVVHMPHAVTIAPAVGLSRAHFGLPESTFLFLTMYDVLSVQERKNPLGALAAFRMAFPNPQQVGFVIRANHASARKEDVAEVRRAIAETPGAVMLDKPMSRGEAQALQHACDAFVSLHRSEGFGLNIAEAMLLGKPVLATGWSGNLDFNTPRNSCLVDYRLLTLTADHGPYRRGSRWADPDLSQAAEYMVRLVRDEAYRRRISASGRETISSDFSPRAIGVRYRRRLDAIRRRGRMFV